MLRAWILKQLYSFLEIISVLHLSTYQYIYVYCINVYIINMFIEKYIFHIIVHNDGRASLDK